LPEVLFIGSKTATDANVADIHALWADLEDLLRVDSGQSAVR
jgi:hypothetical protein